MLVPNTHTHTHRPKGYARACIWCKTVPDQKKTGILKSSNMALIGSANNREVMPGKDDRTIWATSCTVNSLSKVFDSVIVFGIKIGCACNREDCATVG